LRDSEQPRPDVILIATGSEVPLALDAAAQLVSRGIDPRVVAMPSWEMFEAQDSAYRDEVLPPEVQVRVAIEAASTFGWERYVGRQGAMIGIDHFGASAPAEVLYEKFGLTVEKVVETAIHLLG